MTSIGIDPQWLGLGAVLVLLLAAAFWGFRAYQRRARRRALLARLERVGFEADRIAAVKALTGEVPVEGRLLFSNVGKFTKGIPKWVLMLDGIEVEFPVVDRGMKSSPAFTHFTEEWSRLVPQLRPSPHLFTNL
jgi:hypothetical protein